MRLDRSLEICDFCVHWHQKYAEDQKFDDYKKRSVYKCFHCGSDMCEQCVENSAKDVDGTELYAVKFFPCKKCLQHREELIEIGRDIITAKLAEAQMMINEQTVYHVKKRKWKQLS